jgi:hypothetical protein
MQSQNNNNLVIQAKDSIDHINQPMVNNILRGITKGEIKDPEVLKIKPQLQIVNFSSISDQEATLIMQNRIFDFFRLEIPFKDSIQARYTIKGHYEKNNQRKILKKAILQNSEKIGSVAIGQWVQEFDQEYKIEDRDERDVLNFMINNQEAQKLTESQKNVLKRILHTYSSLIADQLVDIFDLDDIKRGLRRRGGAVQKNTPQDRLKEFYRNEERSNISDFQQGVRKQPQARNLAFVKMTIGQAMQKYPGIQEQLISEGSIRIGSQNDSVRGSVKNWIRDYHAVVGAGNKDIMKRSSYAYHGQNAKSLSDKEKQKLLFIMKSLEKNMPVTIDPNKEEIVFSTGGDMDIANKLENNKKEKQIEKITFIRDGEKQNMENDRGNFSRINQVQGNKFSLNSDHFNEGESSEQGAGGNVRFSASQQLPVEKGK